MDATQEEWRPVVGWEPYYEISDHGRIHSLDRTVAVAGPVLAPHTRRMRGRLMKPYVNDDKYSEVHLSYAGRRELARIHVLVLEAFVGPRPDGFVACHGDGDGGNNHVSNLRWDTYGENNFDLVRHGTHWQTRKVRCKNGHEFTAENTIQRAEGGRKCRQCQRDANRRFYIKKKTAA